MHVRPAQVPIFPLSIALVFIVVALLFTYLFLTANMVRGGYDIEEFKDRIADIEKENARLQLEVASVHALDSILEKSDGLQYSEIKQVSYLKKPSHSPFAAR